MWFMWHGVALALSAEDLTSAIARCSGAVHPLPALTEDQRARLASGDIVKIVQHPSDPDLPSRAVGVAVLAGGREALWIAAQDPHASVDPSLTEFIIEQRGLDHAIWYGYLDLPPPLADRHWVVESENTHPLAAVGCWEHRWRLVEGGLDRVRPSVVGGRQKVTVEQLDAAVFTPVNEGNWLMAPLPDGRTVVAYQATSVVGGSIPDWLVLELTMARLESMLRALEARAQSWAPEHYVASHAPVYGGDGAPIARLR